MHGGKALHTSVGGPRPSGSLAARLARWFAASAFILVALAMAVQYRTLVAALVAEDDQLLRERLVDASRNLASDSAERPIVDRSFDATTLARPGAIAIRHLDRSCQPTRVLRAQEQLPPPICPADAAAFDVVLRTIRGVDGDAWRVAVRRLPVDSRGSADGWIEVLLDRSRDREVLDRFRTESAAVLFGALVAATVLGYLVARRGLQPLEALRARVTRIDARSLDLRLAVPSAPSEVLALTVSFDAMLARLDTAFGALSTRTAELAHELRTPLHVMRQQAEVALRLERTPEQYRDVLGSNLEEIDRLRRLADDMLFLARAADPRAVLQCEALPVRTELCAVQEYLEALADEQGIQLDVQAAGELMVHADRALLRRALVNLVTNALRFTPRTGCVTLRAIHGVLAGSVTITVADNGSGMAPELVAAAFEPYRRADGPGVGLGLAIVRGIVELHGGTASLESAPGQGTRATLTMPGAATDSRPKLILT